MSSYLTVVKLRYVILEAQRLLTQMERILHILCPDTIELQN